MWFQMVMKVKVLVTPTHLTLCDLPGSSVHWDSPGKNTGVGCHIPPGELPHQGLNPVVLHSRQILYL